jgi:hypothetical protein
MGRKKMQTNLVSDVERESPAEVRRFGQSHSNFERRRNVEESDLAFQTFTLPLEVARRQVRDLLNRAKGSRQLETVERWRQLADGKIEFTTRRWPAPD